MPVRFRHLVVVAALVPLLIWLHEIGHLLAGLVVGVPNPQLSMGRFVHQPAPWLRGEQIALIAASGPAVTLIFALGCLTLARRRRAFIASALSVAACVRVIELLPYALSAMFRRLRGFPPRSTTFDEDVAFDAIGLPGDIGLIFATIMFLVILYAHLRLDSQGAPSLFGGALLGWIAWTAIT